MKRFLWIMIFIAALAAFWIFANRWALEKTNLQVELVYDFASLQKAKESLGLEMEDLFQDLQEMGIQALGIQAESVGQRLLNLKPLSEEVRTQIKRGKKDLEFYLNYPLAFESKDLEMIRAAGFEVVPKISPGLWEVEDIWLEYHPRLIIVSGSGEIATERYSSSGAHLGIAEFSNLTLPEQSASNLVRVHGISALELEVLSDQRIINRYLRAVKERNIRVLYLRPFLTDETSWDRSLQLLTTLKKQLLKEGFSLGKAGPFPIWSVSPVATILVWTGVWAAAILLAINWFPTYFWFLLIVGVFAWLGTFIISLSCFALTQQALALLAAIIFPCLAVQINRGTTPFRRYLWISGVSLLGALLVVGTLTGTDYLVKLQEFRGVKLMHLAPVFLIFLVTIWPLKRWFNQSVPIKYLALAGAVGLIGLLYLRRTGNFGGFVLEEEVVVREFLEKVLVARPRTKEFLIGHPALYFLVRKEENKNSWWRPLAVVGQLSLINTFTHVHAPLKLGLLRTAYGLCFGYLIGWLVYRCYLLGKRWFKGDRSFGLLRIWQSW